MWLLIVIAVFLFSAARYSYAYLDPGSGSYVFQLLIGGFLVASVSIKTYWKQIKSFIQKKTVRKRDED